MTAPFLPALERSRAHAILEQWPTSRVVVIGDVMLDQFIFGHVGRISPEAPVPVVTYDHDQHRAGGAANVALNARSLGATVELIGVTGDDDAARTLQDLLRVAEIAPHGLVTDLERRTTTKVRVVTMRNQQMARIDYENDEDVSARVEERAGRSPRLTLGWRRCDRRL